MVDNPTTPANTLKPNIDLVDEANKKMDAFEAKATNSVKTMTANLEGAIKEAFKGIADIGTSSLEEFKKVHNIISENSILLNKFTKSYITFKELSNTQDVFSGVRGGASTFGSITDQITSMGTEWGILTKLLSKTPVVGNAASEMLKNLKDNAGYGQTAEAQMIGMLSASGELSKMFNEQGEIEGDLTTKTLKYVNSLTAVAEANGMTMASTVKFADSFNRIPGVMDETITMSDELGGKMSAMNAAMKVMIGSGQTEAEFLKVRDIAYKNLGNSMDVVEDKGKKHLALFATMSTLSKDFNLTFNETSDFLGKVADQFKYVGDNTEAAARVMGKFADALRNTGLTSSASMDIIGEMVKNVGNLTIGTKAFISARSGGPGGLQGSVQIDKLNREGKSDQVMSMVLDTLKKQFGGRIVTQAEGAQSQEAAAQFTKQKMMIQSGAFGNLVGSGPGADEKATRLLEALASGNMGKAAKVGDDAVNAVGKQGNSLQKETNTILNKIALFSEVSAMNAQLSASKRTKQYFGSGNEDIKRTLHGDMESAGVSTADKEDRNLGHGGGTEEDQFEGIFNRSNRDTERRGQAAVTGAYEGGKSFLGDAKDNILGSKEFLNQVTSEREEKEKQERIKRKTPNLGPPGGPRAALPHGTRRDFTAEAIPTQPRTNVQAAIRNAPNNNQGGNIGVITLKLAPGLEAEPGPRITKDANGNIHYKLNIAAGEPGGN